MLTNILFLLACSAGSLAAGLTYSDEKNVYTTLDIEKEEVYVESEDISVIADYGNNIIIVKPRNERTCMIIRGICKLGKDFPSLEEMIALQERTEKIKTINFPNETRSINVKRSVSKSYTLSIIGKKLCTDMIMVIVDISTVDDSAVPTTMATTMWEWWPWWNWWPRRCSWCYHNYCRPCFQWPYWFYYNRFMFVIYPSW